MAIFTSQKQYQNNFKQDSSVISQMTDPGFYRGFLLLVLYCYVYIKYVNNVTY